MLTKDFSLDVRSVSDAGTVEGYASTFGGQPDSYGDVVEPGAFANSLAKHKREGTMPLMLFGHRSEDLPIGKWTDMAEDGKGLWVKGEIDVDDPFGVRVHRAAKSKAIRGLSIGFRTLDSGRDEGRPGVNMLKEVDLWEVSFVNFPANRRARVTDVKSEGSEFLKKMAAGEQLTIRELEKMLQRDFGFSRSEAERAVRIHFKGQGEPDGTADAAAFWATLKGKP